MYFLAKREYDYAIRICAFLAGSGSDSNFTIQELSNKLLISKPFTTKIVYKLKTKNILRTVRGKNGGVLLGVEPKLLSLYDIFEAIGVEIKVSACISQKGFCPLPAPCKIHKFFIEQEEASFNKLKETTIDSFSFTDKDFKN